MACGGLEPGVYSVTRFELPESGTGTEVGFDHTGCPTSAHDCSTPAGTPRTGTRCGAILWRAEGPGSAGARRGAIEAIAVRCGKRCVMPERGSRGKDTAPWDPTTRETKPTMS